MTLTIPTNLGSANDQHSLVRRSLGELTSGFTYYVVGATTNTFKLASAPNGPALSVDGTNRIGTHTIRRAGVELTPCVVAAGETCKGLHELRIDFTGTPPTGAHKLLGPGGISLRIIHTPPADGISSATTEGGSGGVGTIAVPTSRVTATPIAEAYVAGGTAAAPTTVKASGNVKLTTNVKSDLSSYTSNFGIGGIAAGDVKAYATANTTSKAWVGDFDEDTIDDNGVVIEAGTTVALFSDTDIKTYVKAHADSIGLGAGANAYGDVDIDAVTNAAIGDGAIVEADAVSLFAKVTRIRPEVHTDALGVGFVAVAISDSNRTTDSAAASYIRATPRCPACAVSTSAPSTRRSRRAARRSTSAIAIGFIPIPIERASRGDSSNGSAAVVTGRALVDRRRENRHDCGHEARDADRSARRSRPLRVGVRA